jgi:hypothetical protein
VSKFCPGETSAENGRYPGKLQYKDPSFITVQLRGGKSKEASALKYILHCKNEISK